MGALFVLSGWLLIASTLGADPSTAAPTASADMYAVRFRHVWASDACVQRRGQSWEDYRHWLVRFYTDNGGWNATSGVPCEANVSGMPSMVYSFE